MKKQNSVSPQYTEESLPERFDSWISHVLANLTLTVIRSYERKLKRSLETHVENIDEVMAYDPFDDKDSEAVLLGESVIYTTDKKLAEGLRKLSPRKKQVLEGTVILEIPVAVVANDLELDEHTVSNYKYDSIQSLRASYEEDENGQKKSKKKR